MICSRLSAKNLYQFKRTRSLYKSYNIIKRYYRHLNLKEKASCGIGIIANINKIADKSLINNANQILLNLHHRGGCSDDAKNGDGAGIMVNIPHNFYKLELEKENVILPEEGNYGTGLIFFPKDTYSINLCKKIIQNYVKSVGYEIITWRNISKNVECLGSFSKNSEPHIEQVFIKNISGKSDNIDLYKIQKLSTNQIDTNPKIKTGFYICSLSNDMIVYKGLFNCEQLFQYYNDLTHNSFECYMAMVHSRFSTNTQPSWNRAQPYRISCHNGELNTIDGNKNMVKSRESNMYSPIYEKYTKQFYPICTDQMSDSGNYDSFIQWMTMSSDYTLPEILMTTIPEAFNSNNNLSNNIKSFYKFHSCSLEPWDGPALIGFMNKNHIGVIQDRNGLRPSRYCLTKDNQIVISSEAGVLHNIEGENIKEMGGLLPGEILLIDMDQQSLIKNIDVKEHYSNKYNYKEWVKDYKYLDEIVDTSIKNYKIETMLDIKNKFKLFGISDEVKNTILTPMFLGASEPGGSMGNDTPLAFLSKKKRNIFDYFKHSFAQVTNPPIDSIRENHVMSLECSIGKENNILKINKDRMKKIFLKSPILTNKEIYFIKKNKIEDLNSEILDMTFSKTDIRNLKDIILQKCEESYNEILEKDINTIILTDRNVNNENIQIPSILMSSALHNYLIEHKLRNQVTLIVESGGIRESHQICCLLGFGVDGICPYMAYETIKYHLDDTNIPYKRKEIYKNYRNALNKGIYKIMSKMGISSLQSYKGAGKFETIGFDNDIINTCFPNIQNTINTINFDKIKKIFIEHHENVYNKKNIVDGQYNFREGGEIHYNSPEMIYKLQKSVKLKNKKEFKEYLKITDILNKKCTIRGILQLKLNESPISIDEVESANEIVKRFCTGAMSIGSISKEAHETIAIGMNKLGGKSNTGEGGEDLTRFHTIKNSAIKQVASGRFGVSSNYLANAKQIQIKIAQGAKPGEGGELPGFKVTEEMARLRNTKPGVTLISPPPHHDIYSIEDLSQLIYDLQNSNKNASISVKLVSNNGIGIIASGVAKCNADHIVISGYDGGTGSASWNSIKYCGTPWEIGLTETHKTLVKNNLRHKVKLQVDGSIKTSRDIVIASLLGAEEFAFATMPLITIGCIMMRKCHLNICPVGIATQDPILREKFEGKSENIINYFFLLAEEIREIMAQLGFKNMDDMVGRYDKLYSTEENIDFITDNDINYNHIYKQNYINRITNDSKLNNYIIKQSQYALSNKGDIYINTTCTNLDRSIGTMLSYEISKLFGEDGLPTNKIDITLTGIAGQSLGAFLQKGVTIRIIGGCNDYVGKGQSGGIIIVKPPKNCNIDTRKCMIVGNTCFYGGINGKAYINGMGGNRFAVRNSGVDIVVEGIGTNGCEYMTGGSVLILGKINKNLCAGMSGGKVYVYDPNNISKQNINEISVCVKSLDKNDKHFILHQIKEHNKETNSKVSEFLLKNWENEIENFKKIVPIIL